MSHSPHRLTVLISGSGTNLAAIINACNTPDLPNATVARVISNRKNAYGLVRAEEAGIPNTYHNLVPYRKRFPESDAEARATYDKDLVGIVKADGPDLVLCAGWLHVLSSAFLSPMSEAGIPVINLHPAKPEAYNGIDAIKRAHKDWKAGKITETGLMVHDVIEKVDGGTPLLVETVPFIQGQDDDLAAFEQRLHEIEWKAIVQGTRLALEAKTAQAKPG